MTASGVNAVATEGTDEYVAFAILLTLLVGVIRLFLGLVRAGFLVNFMSNPVLSGFVNAAALVIAGSQIPALFGLDVARASTFLDQMRGIWRNIGTFSVWTALIGVGSIVLLLYFQRYFQRHMMRLGVPESLATLMSRTGPLVTAGSHSGAATCRPRG
jgi:SulP family sulfate permease